MQNYPPQDYPPQGMPPGGPLKTQIGGLEQNVAGLISYLPCIGFIASIAFLVSEPKTSRFVRFHALQSLIFNVGGGVVFFVVWLACWVAIFALSMASGLLSGIAGILVFFVLGALGLGMFACAIVALVKAYKNEMWKIPVVGNIAEKYV